ncbi:hypothetical protein [Streptomyces sp. NPDC018610]|uniref:Rv1733c family protein n=1 Tax=Streptomyces sp. NPDC018610 TaxID=3365049 RepID=UPI0037B0B6A5
MPAGIPRPQPPPDDRGDLGGLRPVPLAGAPTAPVPRPASPRTALRRLRGNPLRRRTDLLRAWLALALFLVVPAAAPVAMFLAGDTAYRHYTDAAERQKGDRRQTTAVLAHDAPRHPEPGSAEERRTRYPVEVRFTDPGGQARTAKADVTPGLPVGSTVDVWADVHGRITPPPLTTDQIRSRTMGWAILAFLAVPALAATACATTSRVLHRRDLKAWDRAWRATSPHWTTPT